MAKPFIVKRNTKGSALTFSEQDQNFQNLADATVSIAVTGSDTVTNDLNDTTTFTAVDGIAITAVSSSQTISFDASLVNDLTPQLGGNLDAQDQDITDVSGISFNTATEQNHTAGRIYWDPVDGTLAVGMEYDEVVGKVGMNLFYHVKNQTGSAIPKGTLVMAIGTIGASGQILCAPAVTDGTVNPRFMLGITNMEIANGGDGYAVHFGLIKGIDTQGPDSATDWSDGTVLWADPNTPGLLTDTEPTAPNLKLSVAYVVNAAANGSMFVRANTGQKLQDLHDVDVTGVTNGQTLIYNSSLGIWEPGTAGSGSGTVNSATTNSIAYYATTGTAVSGNDLVIETTELSLGSKIHEIYSQDLDSLYIELRANTGTTDSYVRAGSNIAISASGAIQLQYDTSNRITIDLNGIEVYANIDMNSNQIQKPKLTGYLETFSGPVTLNAGTYDYIDNQVNLRFITLSGNITLTSTLVRGETVTFVIAQDTTGGYTITWPAGTVFAGGDSTINSAASSRTIASVIYSDVLMVSISKFS